MRSLSFNTSTLACVVLIGYIVLGLVYIPGIQYLVSLAAGGIVYGVTESYELSVLTVLLASILFSFIVYRQFVSVAYSEGFVSGSPTEIATRLRQIRAGEGVKGMLAVGAEGFEDAKAKDMTLNTDKKSAETATSGPAATAALGMNGVSADTAAQAKKVLESLTQQLNATAGGSGVGVAAPGAAAGTPPPPPTQGFQGSAASIQKPEDGLFKLGAMPSDAAGGFHIDAGTTVMNALKALKPDQIQAMTKDTQQLIETQKSLMDMLRTFKPMLSDGKEMMETFSQMFAPTAAAGAAAANQTASK